MSQQTVYAIASGKGGVGKTTATVNIGTAIAQAGERVAVVDTDLGMANLAGFVSLRPDSHTLHDVLAGEVPIAEATYTLTDDIVAVPSGTDLTEYAATAPEKLREVVDGLRSEFDYVLLDVGAGVSHETVLPLGLADAVVLVSTPEPAAVHDTKKTIELTDRAGGTIEGLVINRTRPASDVSYEEIADRLEVSLLGTVPEDPTVRDSVYAGTPLVVYDSDSPAATAYRRLAAELADLEVAVADTDDGDDDTTTSHDEVSSAITEAESDLG
ncbi:cell division ATPase MinD [Natrialbaceae archaeon AArc-T1-2]|uniref:cell division ATPase MinD n=1 Tax=Natrialbaceae archaeon AArc-T1-2 TaxID=3053904 RepID=UPI00255B07E5|nr:cell division ATPase MinD [Natrialbaceae archaeon AArc-T1-2]WIV68411.1 cell division ATPase MinD [Natrialbaceae archaeon AArc-T1-2]